MSDSDAGKLAESGRRTPTRFTAQSRSARSTQK